MNRYRVLLAQIHQWLRIWWRIVLEETSAPLFDTNARLQLLSLVALLIFVLTPEGKEPLHESLTNLRRTTEALAYALPIFILLNAVVAAFKATREQDRLGVWTGNRYSFHSPQHISTTVVTDADNGKLNPFKIEGLPTGSSVELIVQVEKGFDDRNIRVQFIGRKDQPIFWDEYERHTMLAFLPSDQTFYTTTLKPTPSNPSTIKVFLMSWYAPAA